MNFTAEADGRVFESFLRRFCEAQHSNGEPAEALKFAVVGARRDYFKFAQWAPGGPDLIQIHFSTASGK